MNVDHILCTHFRVFMVDEAGLASQAVLLVMKVHCKYICDEKHLFGFYIFLIQA